MRWAVIRWVLRPTETQGTNLLAYQGDFGTYNRVDLNSPSSAYLVVRPAPLSLSDLLSNSRFSMKLLQFSGRVIPECVQVSVSSSPTVNWAVPETGSLMEFNCKVEQSRVEIECKIEGYKADHLADVYRRALDIARAQVNLIGFKMGWGLTVVIDSYVDINGEKKALLFHDGRLPAYASAFDLSNGFDEILSRVIQQPLLMMALQELISSISLPHVAPIDCARAMDRLKHLVAHPGLKDDRAWRQLRETLQIGKQYLKFITDHSANPRHGRPGHTSAGVVSEVTRRSWIIMNRYFEFLRRGSMSLPSSEFPLL